MHAAPTIRAGRSAHQVQNPTTTRLPLLAEAPPGLVVEVRHLLGVHCYLFSAEWRKLSVLSVVPTSKMTLLTTAGSRKSGSDNDTKGHVLEREWQMVSR